MGEGTGEGTLAWRDRGLDTLMSLMGSVILRSAGRQAGPVLVTALASRMGPLPGDVTVLCAQTRDQTRRRSE